MTIDPASEAPPARRSTYVRSGLVALAVVVVIALLINFLLLQHRSPGVLDGQVVSQGLSQAIEFNETGHPAPPHVTCPTSEPLRAGLTFTCTLDRNGVQVPILVTEHGNQGSFTYQLGKPPGLAA